MYRLPRSLLPVNCVLQLTRDSRITFLYPLIEPTRILDIYVKLGSVVRKNDTILSFETYPRSYPISPYQIAIIDLIHVRKGERIEMGSPLFTLKLSVL